MKLPAITILVLLCLQPNTGINFFNETAEHKGITAQITVMSYNIRYNNPDDGINAWPNRKDYVAEMIDSKHQSDIAGLQEVLRDQLDDLQSRLPEFSWVGKGRDDGKDAGEFAPIFYRTNRLELLDEDTFWLSEDPDVPGSKSWDAALTRIVTWALFREKETSQEFYVFNTHFDHRGELARLMSARMLVNRISEIQEDIPVIVTGDMNIRETSKAYSVFTEASGLWDARYVSETGHKGPTTSSNNWEELRSPESKIDYIFVREAVRVLSHRIPDDRYEGRFPSDHLPVVADVSLR